VSPRTALGIGALLLGACALGPSTRVEAPRTEPVRAGDSLMTPAARGFLDSLALVRQQERGDSAGVALLWRPRPLALDSTSDLPWLDVLGDPVLETLVRRAVANNRDIQVAVARVREYRALLGVARGELIPQVTLNGTASESQIAFGSFPVQNFNVVRFTGDLSWELDFWGKLRRQTQAAGFDYRGREEDERAAVVSLVSDVASAYLSLRELDQNLAISEATRASRESTLRLARQRFAQGIISELDVRQFEAEVAVAAGRVADFARQRAEKENELSVLLGQAPGPIERGKPLEGTVQAVVVPDSIPAALLLRRPDVRRAERDLQAATARIGVAFGNLLPRISIVGQYGRQRQTFHDLFDKDNEIYTAQVGVSIPLPIGGRLIDQHRAARARADQARARYEQAVLTALREGSDALGGLRLLREELAAQATQAEALRRALALAQRRYENGVSSYLEVLDAQRGLFSAELALVQVERRYLEQTVRLYKAMGGSWEQPGRR